MCNSLAKNLYTSNARFVFELLQNAEDNHYTRAREQGQRPYISFDVFHDRLVIDCNEDGFTQSNLRAICDVGKSSKTGAQGYVGEKGIGFKSVFMAAWKVHIQSGDYSFYFKHHNGDSGLGMISPAWQDVTMDLPQRNLTRMTLLLHDTGDAATLLTQRQSIRQQFNDLKDSILLFMTKLEEIRITLHDESGAIQTRTVFSSYRVQVNRMTVSKSVSSGDEPSQSSRDYHITKASVGGLSKNENRTYSELEEKNKSYSNADIVLGFPLSQEGTPVIEPQDVFAFLPMRHVGFSVRLFFLLFFLSSHSRLRYVADKHLVLDSERLCDASQPAGYSHHVPAKYRYSHQDRRRLHSSSHRDV